MAREHPLDRLERLLKRDLEESRRERREWRKKLRALNDLQARNREGVENSYREVHTLLNSREELARPQTETEESLNDFMDTVKRLIDERREEKS
jgi:predicted transcriptional regulator